MVSKIKEKSIANNAITTSKLSAEVVAVTGIKVSSIVYLNDDTAANTLGGDVITVNGSGFSPTTTVYVDRTQAGVVTYLSNNQITFSSPAKTAGSYILYLYNADGGSAAYIPGINYSGVPAWSTASGSIGTTYEFTSFTGNVSTLSATSDSTVYYLLNSGTLPPGSTLNANTGVISGNTSVINSQTTYNFTIEAKDQENQGTLRNFSITINPDVVTWNSPANGATINVSVGTAASQSLNASSAGGQSITYTANTLPTGLSISGNTVTGTPTVVQSITSLITATAALTNRTATRILNWIVALANDLNFPYVSTLLKTSASSTRSTTVVDSSTNAFTVTRNGAPSTGWTSPYQTDGYWGNYFNGSTDYLTTPANAAFAFGTGDFTVESWVYTTARIGSGNYGSQIAGCNIFGTSADWIFNISPTGNLFFQIGSSPTGAILSSSTVPLNTWTHIAAVRSSGVVTLYINGTNAGGSGSYTSSVTNASTPFSIGGASNGSANSLLQGYISNLRIVKGTAVYTGAFTPSTTPLTAITNTSLLTCQSNRFKDNSTNSLTFTSNGTPQVTPYYYPSTFTAPAASPGAGYFNGTSDYLTGAANAALAVGTGQFTIEMWIYFNSLASAPNEIFTTSTDVTSGKLVIYYASNSLQVVASGGAGGTSASFTPTTGQWYHIAASRDASNNQRLFVNGALLATATSTNNYLQNGFALGRSGGGAGANYTNGYISNLRLVVGTAVYTAAFTPPTSPVTAISGTQLLLNLADSNYTSATNGVQNNTFIDSSNYAFPITRNGTATQGSVTPYWPNGYWSNYFDGSSYITAPNNVAFAFGTGNFTIEAWVYVTNFSSTRGIFDSRSSGNEATGITFYVDASGFLQVRNSGSIAVASTALIANTWNHCAVTRSGTSLTIWLNGASVAAVTNSTNFSQQNSYIGRAYVSGFDNMLGYIANHRVVKGTAVYTSAFTPSTTPLTAITNTSLLTCQSNRFIDNSTNNFTITTSGNPTVQAFQPFSPTASYTTAAYGGSGYFNGSTDYISAPSNAAFAFGTGDFTTEGWFYPTSATSFKYLFSIGSDANFTLALSSGSYQPYFYAGSTIILSSVSLVGNQWNHVALVRSGTTATMYINGVSGGSATFSASVAAGILYVGIQSVVAYYFPGYMSNLRIVKGIAVYTGAFTPPTLASLTTAGSTSAASYSSTTNVNTSFASSATSFLANFTNAGIYDAAVQNNAITVGDAQASTTQSKWSPTSIKFDGSGDSLTLPSNSIFAWGTGNFTVELWVNNSAAFTSSRNNIAGTMTSGGGLFAPTDTSMNWNSFGVGDIVTFAYVPTIGQWYHLAYSRSSGTGRLFINGILVASASDSTNYTSTSFTVGGTTSQYFNGYIQDLRVTRGVARYTATFTAPTAEFIAR